MSKTNVQLPRLLLAAFALAGCFWMSPARVSGQTVTGTMQGTIRDAAGAVIQGATVTIRNTETGLERTLTTNEEGFFVSTYLPLGRYDVTAARQGFGSVVRQNLEVALNNTTVADFTLEPSIGEQITVTTEQAQINTTNQQIAQSLTAQQIEDRPVANQTNFLTLAETFTGYQENPTSGQNNPTLSSGSSINFNGTGSRGATFQINGVNNDDASENQNRQGAALPTIKEFQVISNSFSAEFGRGYGAVVLVQTKSGSNRVGGEVYLFHQDSALNATRNIFSPGLKKPVDRTNQYGFVVGFPFLQNKLFGFVSFDQRRYSGALNLTRDLILAGERNPATWFQQTPANNTPANRQFIESVIGRFPTNLVPNDPRSPRTWTGQFGVDWPDDDYSGRLDWIPNSSDNVVARWQYTRQKRQNEQLILGEQTFQNNKQQNIGLTWTHLFSPTTVGEFRYGLGLRTTLVNLLAGNDTPIIRFTGTPVATTIIGNAGAYPIQRWQTDNQFVYNLSTLFGGNHFFKAGTDIRRQQLDDLADNFSRGFWTFQRNCNGIDYGTPYNAFFNGCVSQYWEGYGPYFVENRINEYNFYAEDNWRVRPNLTLNLGARYEYVAAPVEADGRINYGFGDDKNNIEPRVGFAWSPGFGDGFWGRLFGGPGQSSIRGGYGLYHGRLFQSVFSQGGAGIRYNPPNALFQVLASTTTANTNPNFNPNNLADPTNGFVFVPGPQPQRHSITIADPGLEMPYTQQWNLSFERQLPFASALRLSYTGNRGIGLLRYVQGNLPIHDPANGVPVANQPNNAPAVLYPAASQRGPGDPRGVDVRGQVLRPAADLLCAGTGLPGIATNATCPNAVPIGALEYSFRLPRYNERRPDARHTTNLLVGNGAWSYYNGLQVEWTKRLSRGLNFQAAYTWSKAIDTTSEATFVGTGDTNSTGPNQRISRGLSRFDTRHRLTVFGTYRSPFFREQSGFVGQALGGWTVSMVMKLVSGTPFTVVNSAGTDLNLDGVAELRPALIDPSILGRSVGDPSGSQEQLPRSAFRAATVADYDCCLLGRNTFFIDGTENFDFSIYKTFAMPFEGHRLTFRADLFNAFNHVQYGFPVNDIATPTQANFGRILSTATLYNPRVVQFSFRYQF